MLTYLLEKFDKIKKERGLYCSKLEEDTRIEEKKDKKDKMPIIYDFICKNTRKK
jgi:hypothetical protein